MLTITGYGGIGEIGGNKILLESYDESLFLDFGRSFDIEAAYFDWASNTPFHVPSLLSIGAIPDLPGLYRHEPSGHERCFLVSHPHQDHAGYLPLLAPDSIVVGGADTKAILSIRAELGPDRWDTSLSHLDWRLLQNRESVAPGEGVPFGITAYAVDHSVPGSYGFIVDVNGKTVAYTGDLRFHGPRAHETEAFVETLERRRVDVLICEGTRVVPPEGDPDAELLRVLASGLRARWGHDVPAAKHIPCSTEIETEEALKGVMEGAEGLVLVEVSPLDFDRMNSVWAASISAGRTVVLPARQAYMLYESSKRADLALPDPRTSVLYLAQRHKRRSSHTRGDPGDAEAYLDGRPDWERVIARRWQLAGGQVYWGREGRAELRTSCSKYVVCAPQCSHILPELCYRAEPCPLVFVLSKSEAFAEDALIAFDKLLRWLALFGADTYYVIHTSGHADSHQLRNMIERVSPATVVPVHTRHPELFTAWHDGVRLLRRSQPTKL